jgi:hypothetical protein
LGCFYAPKSFVRNCCKSISPRGGICVSIFFFSAPAEAAVILEPSSIWCDSPSHTIQTGALPVRDGVQGLKVFGKCENPFATGGGEQVVVVSGGSGGPDAFESDHFYLNWELRIFSALENHVGLTIYMHINRGLFLLNHQEGPAPSGTLFRGSGRIDIPNFVPGSTKLDEWTLVIAGIEFAENGPYSMVTIDIPPNSIDIATDPLPAEVPEPGTVFAGIAALAVGGARVFRARQR